MFLQGYVGIKILEGTGSLPKQQTSPTKGALQLMETIDFVGHPARMCSTGKWRKIVREKAVGDRFLLGPLLNDLKGDRETKKQPTLFVALSSARSRC